MSFKKIFFALPMLLSLAVPAFAGTYVSSPANGSQVNSPFTLTVTSDTCGTLPVAHIGFSMDNSTYTFIYAGTTMNGPVTSGTGWHMVHVKTWNTGGGVCDVDVSINVVNGATSVIPANAVASTNIQALGNWFQIHDGGTPGSSSGWTGTQGAPSLTGWAREFVTNFTYFGGQRYSVLFDNDSTSTNYFYDAWIYVANNADGFSNVEFDINHTLYNGETVIMGFQCDSWINRWDYSVNGGSPTAFWDTWLHSNAPCNVHNWGANQWHHIQVWYSLNYSGWVTYHTVWLDNVQEDINATVFSGYMLGWAPGDVTNFQIDGSSSGSTSSQVYLDKMTVYRW